MGQQPEFSVDEVAAMFDPDSTTSVLAMAVRRELLRIARHEEDLAAAEAAQVPYWAPYPASVQGHRAAAAALPTEADLMVAAS